jgi:hypothetical protein
MKLYSLFHKRSKYKRETLLMTDSMSKCLNYMEARKNSGVAGHHEIRLAKAGESTFRKKSATVGGNKCTGVPKIKRGGKTERLNGWIGKNGFNPHT